MFLHCVQPMRPPRNTNVTVNRVPALNLTQSQCVAVYSLTLFLFSFNISRPPSPSTSPLSPSSSTSPLSARSASKKQKTGVMGKFERSTTFASILAVVVLFIPVYFFFRFAR